MKFVSCLLLILCIGLLSCKTGTQNIVIKPSANIQDTIGTKKWLFSESYYSNGKYITLFELDTKMQNMPETHGLLKKGKNIFIYSMAFDILGLTSLGYAFVPGKEIIGISGFVAAEVASWYLYHQSREKYRQAIKIHNEKLKKTMPE